MSDVRSAFKLAVRRFAHAFLVAGLRFRSQKLVVEGTGGVCLIVAPHPDDEALGCAGLIHARRALGRPVHILYLTDGSGSHPGHPTITPNELAKRRHAEARAAMQLLGLSDDCLHFADAPDSRLAHLSPSESSALSTTLDHLLRALNPTELFLPYRHDGSSEHIAAFEEIERALSRVSQRPRIYEFPIWSWWSPRLLFRPLREAQCVYRLDVGPARTLKERALRCYLTQLEPLEPDPAPVLSEGFLKFFLNSAEYYFETYADVSPPSSSPAPGP